MSRIHDALRRGHAPANLPQAGRTAHADAVLSALGYQSEKPKRARPAMALLVLLATAALALLTWALVPWRDLFPANRPEPRPAVARPALPAPPSRAMVDAAKPVDSQAPSRVSSPPLPATRTPVAAVTAPPAPVQTPPARLQTRSDAPDAGVTPRRIEARPSSRESVPQPVSRPAVSAANPAAVRAPSPASKAIAPAPDEFQLALYYQRAGDFEQALVHYRAALQRDEMNVEAHNNLGHLYLGKNLYDEAAREFQRVLAIDSKYLNAHLNLSAAYLSLKRFDAAAAEARVALQIDPRSPDAMVNLALAQNAAGQAADAQGSLRRALEIDPRNAAAHYNLALQYETAGEVSAAIDHYKLFIQYASPEQTAYAADVRTRLGALGARIK